VSITDVRARAVLHGFEAANGRLPGKADADSFADFAAAELATAFDEVPASLSDKDWLRYGRAHLYTLPAARPPGIAVRVPRKTPDHPPAVYSSRQSPPPTRPPPRASCVYPV
jgi:hypothetical protein